MTTFAATNNRYGGQFTRLIIATGFFYALSLQYIYGSVPPCEACNTPTAVSVLVNGKDRAVFYSVINNFFQND